jgi:predicted secreted protein
MKKTIAAMSFAACVPLALAGMPSSASADTMLVQQQPSGVLSLSAQASEEVPQDVVDITMFYEKEAGEPASLTDELNRHAQQALSQAKGVSGVTARTGAFSIDPMTDRDGHISSWRGRTEVILESRDFAAASKLAGQMNSAMQVGGVSFSLSPEAQRKAAEKLTTEAIKNFRAQADSAAKAFGYTGYTIRDVNVNSNNAPPPRPMFAMRAMAAAAPAQLPVEAGKSTVTVTVSGSVQMTQR